VPKSEAWQAILRLFGLRGGGAGLDLDIRLEIVREIFQTSETTTVHLKDVASGPGGFLPFVRSVLAGLGDSADR
jgi:hypothetical protein